LALADAYGPLAILAQVDMQFSWDVATKIVLGDEIYTLF
jgi:hypothetical protein